MSGQAREKKPLVSVIVTTFNHADFIGECLDGILMQQTSFEFEVIVGDDASTDGTSDIVLEYASRFPGKVIPVIMESNLFSQARSIYFEEILPRVRGKFIAVCDGDDYWTSPEKLQTQTDFLLSHPDYSLCFHNVIASTSSGQECKGECSRLRRNRTIDADTLLLMPFVQLSSVVIRSDYVKNDAYFRQLLTAANFSYTDVLVYAACAHIGKIFGIAKPWSVYRRHSGSITASGQTPLKLDKIDRKMKDAIYKSFDGEFSYLRDNEFYLKALDRWTFTRRRGRYRLALAILWRAFVKRPRYFIYSYYRRYLL